MAKKDTGSIDKMVVVSEETWLKIKELIWNNPDLLIYEKGVKWLEELREVMKE